ncbi:MAG: hypothetical protein MJ175_05295 [Clostridia bacterium]|nr:hypothetical protein [Clostridia bacterium]
MSESVFNPSASLGGIDSLGRMLPTEPIIRPDKSRQVGLFYFLWCGEHGRHRPYDVSKITAANPDAGSATDSPFWGGEGTYHHWGEPFYGYYYSDDEWVIRRHMTLFCDAGVDFLFFDTTNAIIYEKNVKIVLRVLQEYHDAGFRIPKVMFYTNTASGQTVEQIYRSVYAPKYCPDTWFCFGGKPVIIAKEEECSPETQAFFNIKMSQWPNEPDKRGGWPWMDFTRPQRVFENLDGEEEVINVSVAQHPQLRFGDSVLYGETTNCGRMYHDGANDPSEEAFLGGANFGEQFDRAIETDPPVVLVTGWNEWIAGRWPGIPERPIMFVDCADAHYSRDLEMMRGGYFDNYYLQFISCIRRYKGQEAADTHICRHVPGGDFRRDNDGYDKHYKNDTGRNPLASLYAEKVGDELIVRIKSHKPLEADRSGCFMQAFITGKGECGGVLTARMTEDGAVLSRVSAASWNCVIDSTPIKAVVADDSVEYRIPAELLPGGELWVKAADSREPIRRGEDFYDRGDCVPAGRLWFICK